MRYVDKRTKSDQVYEAIRESIVTGDLIPGYRLVIKNLANEMGVSEIPIREALKLIWL